MEHRIKLEQYTVEELREIEAGPLCDWLVAQAMSGNSIYDPPIEDEDGHVTGDTWSVVIDGQLVAFKYDKLDTIYIINESGMFSRNWSAAGRALEWLHKKIWYMSLDKDPFGWSCTFAEGFMSPVKKTCSNTPLLAICRAVLVFARQRMDGKGAGQ